MTTAVIYSLGHGLGTSSVVPKSTQPSTLGSEMVKRVSAYGLSNNNNGDDRCGWQLLIFGRLTAQVNFLQCFNAVGWAAACKKLSGGVLA